MYLVLFNTRPFGENAGKDYSGHFTENINAVAEFLTEENVRVFKLDSLVEVKRIDATFQEITTEMESE